jgi:predicted HAD superfamily Cof-like phosphohydrolase
MHNQSLLQQAITFRQAMEQPINTTDETVHELQANLIIEEYIEFYDEFNSEFQTLDTVKENQVNQLKELADLVFVCYQYAAARGWDLDTAMRRVFESNMSKLVDGKPLRRADGKVLKGPNYQPPTLDDLI